MQHFQEACLLESRVRNVYDSNSWHGVDVKLHGGDLPNF